MEDFRVIYRILKILDAAMSCEEFDPERISPAAVKCDPVRWEKLLIQMQKAGYIEGLSIRSYIRQPSYIQPPISPQITLKGMEYLQENSLMKKAADMANGIAGTAVDLVS